MKNYCNLQNLQAGKLFMFLAKKIPLSMKLFLLTLLCSIGMLQAAGSYAQNARISLHVEEETVADVLVQIEELSDFDFFYNNTHVDLNRRVSVSADNSDIFAILDEVFAGTDVRYTVLDKKIILSTELVEQTSAQQQGNVVRGKVVDVNGEPVIGANVTVKGNSSIGTITDIEGRFTLNVPADAVLLVSYIGFAPQEVSVRNRSEVNISLREDTELLDEVVVVGFGTQKKVNLTGAIGVAEAEDLESRPVTNATQALQGLIPGLQISTNTGELDKNMSINIRGTGTIGEGSSDSPLILIDGMEGDLNSINPQDIESVSVLKDAAASSIYGSRAPFGVILITTKKGQEGKFSINYNNSFRVSSPIHMPEMMDSYAFANYFNSASNNNNGAGNVFTEETMQRMLDYQAGIDTDGILASSNGQWGKPDNDPFRTAYANTDWYKEIYKSNVFSQEHNVSLNGGTSKVAYYASFNYLNQSGLLRHGSDGLNRYNATAKINSTITNWLKFNYGMRFSRIENYRPTSFNDTDMYDKFGRQTWPNLPVYDPNGYYHNMNAATPAMSLALGGDRNSKSDRLSHQVSILIEPIKNWITHIDFNYSTLHSKVSELSLPLYNRDVNGNEIVTNGDSSLYGEYQDEDYLNLNVYSEYAVSFNEKHNMKYMIGFQAEEENLAFMSSKKYGVLIEGMPEFDLTTGTDGLGNEKPTETSGYHQEWATAGFFGRINYDYEGRYLAEVNMRYDGTSRFRRGSRWQLYPSFSLGWNIARENFWELLSDVANTLKLRVSYGELGNQNTNNWYPTYRILNVGTNNSAWLTSDGQQVNIATVGDLVSNALTWETIRTWNVGLDWGFFNNRLTGSFDYYIRYTKNMVGPAPELPLVLGIATPKTNNCDLQTRGWELMINWNDRLKNGLGYNVRFMLSDAKTIIDSYPGNFTGSINPGNNSFVEGREMGEIWGFETIGIAQTEEQMKAHLENVGGQDAIGSQWDAGDIMYANIDGKQGITEGSKTLDDHGDLKVIGNNTPRFQFGIDISADWKGFDFRCFFQGVMKRDYWQSSCMFWGVIDNQWFSTGLKEHSDYFRAEPIGLEGHKIPANLDSYYPRPIFSSGSKNQKPQTSYLQDASYIRLKNLQLGYTLPVQLTQKVGLTKCRIFVSGENLWTGTSLSKLFDPETLNGGKNGMGNAYPLSRTWSFGLSLTL